MESVGLQAAAYEGARQFRGDFDPAQPGCPALDVRLKHMSGFELPECLRCAGTAPRTVMIAGQADFTTALSAMTAEQIAARASPCASRSRTSRVSWRWIGNPGPG